MDPFAQPPLLPKAPTSAPLTEESFRSDDEIWGKRFEGGHAIGIEAEHLMLEQVQLHGCVLDSSILYGSRLTDARLDECSLANLVCERLIVRRAEFVDCRLVGLNITDGHLENVLFRECDAQLARFRFSSFKSVLFDGCNLQDANFQGADLSGVRFRKCDLSRAELSQAKLTGTDFRSSVIEGMRVGPAEVVGAVVDHFQAAYMASLLGLVIKDEDTGMDDFLG